MSPGESAALLRGMLEIPSPSGDEKPLATWLAGEMERLGLVSSVDGAGNVVGRRGSPDAPMILLLGHLDTVPHQIPVRQEGSLLYGRGAVDAKGPLATMICAVAQSEPADVQLVVVGAVEEETPGSRGAHYLLERYDPAAVLIGEPSGWSDVVIGYKGRVSMCYQVHRPSTHSAGPGEKATEVALGFWNRLVGHFATFGDGDGLFYRPTATLLSFAGDMEQARLHVDCRTPPGFDGEAFNRFLETSVGDAGLELEEHTPAVLMERSAPTVHALIRCVRSHGGKPRLKVKTGTSDMNTVAKKWAVPMAAYGPGDSSLDHTDEEHVDLEEFQRAIRVLNDALPLLGNRLAELAAPEPEAEPDDPYSVDEEAELTKRLEALGYLE